MRRVSAVLATVGLAALVMQPRAEGPSSPPTIRTHDGVHLSLRLASYSGPTSWPALNTAIHALPTYHRNWARWVIGGPAGWWSTTDWYAGVVYIHRSVPTNRLYSVAAHEWGHILEARAYDGRIHSMVRALRRYYGGSGLMGAEYAADCMARVQGATWTNYTSCRNRHWRHGPRRLLRGERV